MSDKPVETPAAEAKAVEETTKVEETATTAVEAPAETPAADTTAAATETAAKEATPAEKSATEAAETKAAETKPAETAAAETAATEPKAAEEKPGKATDTATAATPAAAPPKTTPIQALYAAAKENGYPEIWGVTLQDPDKDVPSQIVFQKYLNANDGDLAKSKDQLIKTLEWRAKTKPLELLKQQHSSAKFAGLGYVTTYLAGETYDPAEPETKEIFTWNIYGSTKDINETFGNLPEFIKWRVTLMELAMQDLALDKATKPITAEYDPYKIFQIHDYKGISFLRVPSAVRAGSTETIKVLAQNYPELLKEKFFVNVPAIMGFVYAFMKVFVAAKTIKKFHPMSNGSQLVSEFGDSKVAGLGERLPLEYGGKAGELKAVGKETLLTAAPAEEVAKEAPKEEPKTEAQEAKPEAKEEAKEEAKPEVKEEAKPEAKEEAKADGEADGVADGKAK